MDTDRARWGGLTRSLRFRLTIWYTGILGLILIIGFGLLYVGAQRGLLSQTDLFLSVEAQRIAESANGPDGPDLNDVNQAVLSPAIVPETRYQREVPPMGRMLFDVIYIRVLTRGERRVLATSPDLTHHPELIGSLDVPLSKSGAGDTSFIFAGPDEQRMRLLTRPLPGGRTGLWLQVAVPWDSSEDLLLRLRAALIIALPFLLMLAGAGGWFLVGSTLAPIQRIVRQAESLNADDPFDVLLPQAESDTEIGHLVATLNAMMSRLRQAFEAQQRFAQAQQRFAADASHELRTPLTIVRGEMELALARPRSIESYQATIRSAVEEIDRMSQIVQALSFLARQDALQLAAEAIRQPVDLTALAQTVVGEFDTHARDKRVSIDFKAPGPAVVLGDEGQLHQLARNLVENAIKYTPDGGQVHVMTSSTTAGFVLAVQDNGIGIAPEDLPHVFERFWRADRARTASGSGLGLAISARIAEVHGGRLEARSTVGVGSRFELYLPAPPRPLSAPETRPMPSPEAVPSAD